MMAALPTTDRNRLVKLLGLLASDKAGERDAAGLAAVRLLKKHRVSWADLLAKPPVHREPLQSTWRTTCADLIERRSELRPWEQKFLAELPKFRRLSTKQRYVLSEIAERVLGPRNG
jgi:hypothetical protein